MLTFFTKPDERGSARDCSEFQKLVELVGMTAGLQLYLMYSLYIHIRISTRSPAGNTPPYTSSIIYQCETTGLDVLDSGVNNVLHVGLKHAETPVCSLKKNKTKGFLIMPKEQIFTQGALCAFLNIVF